MLLPEGGGRDCFRVAAPGPGVAPGPTLRGRYRARARAAASGPRPLRLPLSPPPGGGARPLSSPAEERAPLPKSIVSANNQGR